MWNEMLKKEVLIFIALLIFCVFLGWLRAHILPHIFLTAAAP